MTRWKIPMPALSHCGWLSACWATCACLRISCSSWSLVIPFFALLCFVWIPKPGRWARTCNNALVSAFWSRRKIKCLKQNLALRTSGKNLHSLKSAQQQLLRLLFSAAQFYQFCCNHHYDNHDFPGWVQYSQDVISKDLLRPQTTKRLGSSWNKKNTVNTF